MRMPQKKVEAAYRDEKRMGKERDPEHCMQRQVHV